MPSFLCTSQIASEFLLLGGKRTRGLKEKNYLFPAKKEEIFFLCGSCDFIKVGMLACCKKCDILAFTKGLANIHCLNLD